MVKGKGGGEGWKARTEGKRWRQARVKGKNVKARGEGEGERIESRRKGKDGGSKDRWQNKKRRDGGR